MTYIPVRKPDADGMVRCWDWHCYCPLCWDDLWWIAGTGKTVCRGCKRYTEERIGTVDLKYNPLEEEEPPDFLTDPRYTWVQEGYTWVGTRWNRDGTRHTDCKTGELSEPRRVITFSGEEIHKILNETMSRAD